MLARRLLLLVAVLMALTVVATLVAPPPPKAPVATTGGAEAPAEPADDTTEIRLDAGAGRQNAEVGDGDLVHLVVTAKDLDTVEIPDLGLVRAVAPDSPAEFDLLAQKGDYPIVLLDAAKTIGTLRVTGR
jgi:hypothetical protein